MRCVRRATCHPSGQHRIPRATHFSGVRLDKFFSTVFFDRAAALNAVKPGERGGRARRSGPVALIRHQKLRFVALIPSGALRTC